MNFLDLVILVLAIMAATSGYRMGFATRTATWVGVLLAAVLVIRILPGLLGRMGDVTEVNRLGIAAILILFGTFLGQLAGTSAGMALSKQLPDGNWRVADRAMGAGLGVLGVLVVSWLLLPGAADVPGWTSQQVRSSIIARALADNAPNPPAAINSLRDSVVPRSFQSVFEGLRPAPDNGPAPESSQLSPDLIAKVKESTVRVEGVACRRTQNGSGFAVGPNLFVTNAHVVAGEKTTSVYGPDGDAQSATVVAFDPERDIAVLRTTRYRVNPLTIADAKVGAVGAVFGHPGGQEDIEVSPASVSERVTAVGRDLYNRDTTRREVLILSSQLRQGDSGGALIGTEGQVMGVAFAIAPDNPNTAYALATSEMRSVLATAGTSGVSTGPCISS